MVERGISFDHEPVRTDQTPKKRQKKKEGQVDDLSTQKSGSTIVHWRTQKIRYVGPEFSINAPKR